MKPARATVWTEWAVDLVAATALGAAIVFALAASPLGPQASLAGGAASFVIALAGLRKVPVEQPTYALAEFALAPLPPVSASAGPVPAVESETELLLDDRLTNVEPDSRVVRLFDVRPGRDTAAANPDSAPDASQALSEALAELRRSLR